MAGPDNKGTTRLATLPSDLLDDHAPAFVPGWMAQDKLDKPTPSNHNQGERVQINQNNGGWGNDLRPAKPGWVEEKPRGNENRWDKPGGGPFVERPKPFGAVDDHHHVNMSPGGPPMGGKWREDGDRVLPRREPVPRWAAGEDARWMVAPGAPDNFGGGDRWEPKGRGRGGLEPPRRPQEGFPDRWVNPADPVRPRGDKWGPAEGEHHELHVDRWGHRPLGINGPPMGRGAPGFGPGAGPGGFGEPQHHPMEPGRGRGFAPGRGRGLHLKGPGGVGSPGAFTQYVKWGAPEAGAPIGHPGLAPEGGALIAASDTPPLGSRTAKRLYRKPDSVTIYKRLAAAKALVLPPEVDREDPSLFAEAGQPDVLEVLLGVHQPGTGGEPAAVHAPFPAVDGAQSQPKDAEEPSKQEQANTSSDAKPLEGQRQQDEKTGGSDPQDAMDEWVYQDPQGVVQGPFTRVDIIEWYEGNFFPPTLPIRSAKDPPSAPFKPLSAMLRVWGAAPAGPPGFASQEKTEGQQAAAGAPAVSQATAVNLPTSAVSSQPEQPPPQPSRPETSRFQHVFAQSAAAQPPQEEATLVQRKSFEQQSQPQTAALGGAQPWQQQHFQGRPQPALQQEQHPLPVPHLSRNDGPSAYGRPQEQRLVAQGQDPLLAQFQSMALGAADRPQGHNYRQEQPGLQPFPDLHTAHQKQEHFPDVLMQLQHPQQQHFQQQQQHLHTQDPLYMQGLERGRALMDALNPQHGFGQQHNMHAPGLQHAPWMQHQPNQHFANQHHAHQAPGALPHPEPTSLAAWLNDAQPTEAQQQQQQSLLPQQFLAHTGQHPGQGQQPPQHHLQRPMPQQQQQQQQQQHQQQHRIVSDPVINPATLLQAGRVPSGPLPPIGQGVDSRGSSSNNLAQQASSAQMPGNVSDLFPFLQSSTPSSQEAQVTMQQQAQAVPQPLPQVIVGAPSGARPTAEAETAGSRLGAWSQAPPAEAPTAQQEPSSASAPFEKVKGKQRKAKPIAEDPQRTVAYQPYEPAPEEQQPKHNAPPMQQPAVQEEQRYVETRPAPWAKHVPASAPGQKSLLDIQREEAERAAAAQAAEAAEAATRGPVITAGPGGWAKVAAANVSPPYQGNGSDAAMQKAMAASLRDIQEHEERVRKQAQQAQRETMGPNGEPVQPQGGTLADAFREKGLLAPKQAGWAGNAAAKLAKPAGGLKEVQAQELEQQRKKAAQQKPAAQAQKKQKANDEDDVMFWDYGNPAGGGTPAKPNGSAAAPAQRVNGTAGGPTGSGAGKEKQGSSASRQQSKPAEDEPFSGTPMSPEFEAWCKEQMVKLQGQDDLTLVRFLLSCASTGEVAEYISAYLGKSAEVSKFTSEFLKRKYAEASGKKVKKGNDAAAAAPKVHPGVTAAGAGGGVPSATGWQKLPAKGKKKKDKGRKMEAGMLGFETGVKYDLLERGDA